VPLFKRYRDPEQLSGNGAKLLRVNAEVSHVLFNEVQDVGKTA
jgi:hypothetical protein